MSKRRRPVPWTPPKGGVDDRTSAVRSTIRRVPTRDVTRPSHRRELFSTSDPDRAHERLRAMYGADARMTAARAADGSAGMAISYVDTGDLVLAQVDFHSALRFVNRGTDRVVIDTVLDGAIEMESGPTASRYSAGDVFVATQPGIEWPGRTQGVSLHAVTLSVDLLRDVAGQAPDGDTGGAARCLPFTDPVPQVGGGRRWRRAVKLVDELLQEPATASPLVVDSAGRLLAATALSLFPTSARPSNHSDRRDAHSPAVGRAVAFIESNPDRPMTVGDIARAAYVSPRAVQIAFRRHLDTTPMAYLRRVRLDRAHSDLAAATPTDGTTVTAVAARWGFGSPSRFAADYRRAYGRAPQQTLRRI